jgi:hypothetical protein
MHSFKILAVLFALFLALTIIFMNTPRIASVTLFLSALTMAIGLFHFLSTIKIKKMSGIKIEELGFIKNFVYRAYTKPKSIWIMYDKRMMLFRCAEFSDLPINVGMTFLAGLIMLQISYFMLSTMNQAPEFLAFRATTLVIFLVIGVYNLFVSLARMFSIRNIRSEKLCSELNKNKELKGIIERGDMFFEITPNFLLWDGFVTSIEFISKKRFETKFIEKHLIQIAKMLDKIK